jgi:hypothetical protein
MTEIVASDRSFEAKLAATVASHLFSYKERSEALKVYNDERLYLPAPKRRKLRALGTKYRQQLESIFVAARKDGIVRNSVDPHFSAHAVIGLCNSFGDLIVRHREPDVKETIRRCTDLLINGFVGKLEEENCD